jgi:hypothetical protein
MHSVERRSWRRKFGYGTLTVSVIIAFVTALSGTSVAVTTHASRLGSGHGRSVQGTITAKNHHPGTRTKVTQVSAPKLPDATGALSTVLSVTVNGGYTAAGIGMRNLDMARFPSPECLPARLCSLPRCSGTFSPTT